MKRLIPLIAMRANCKECSRGSAYEVKNCPIKNWPLYSYRFGKNPGRQGIGGSKPNNSNSPTQVAQLALLDRIMNNDQLPENDSQMLILKICESFRHGPGVSDTGREFPTRAGSFRHGPGVSDTGREFPTRTGSFGRFPGITARISPETPPLPGFRHGNITIAGFPTRKLTIGLVDVDIDRVHGCKC